MRRMAFLVLLAACSGPKTGGATAGPKVEMIPLPEKMTKAVLAGALCEGDHCTCRKVDAPEDGGVGYPGPEDTSKRFEIHLGPAENELWMTVDDMVLYKTDQHAEECFYVDLAPGQHRVILRASRDGGLSAAFDIHELGEQTKSWYDTFHFSCGAPGTCSLDALDEWKEWLGQYTRNLFDPCGSTKVKQVAWDAGRSPDQMHPRDLQVEATMQVYEFEPDKPHGDESCKDRIKE